MYQKRTSLVLQLIGSLLDGSRHLLGNWDVVMNGEAPLIDKNGLK